MLNSTDKSCTSPPVGAEIVKSEAVGVPTVNPKEYAACVPELPPVFVHVTENEFELITVTVALKLSVFAFLIITISPFDRPCELWVIVNVVPDLVQLRPVFTVELETSQHSTSEFRYAWYLDTVL